MASALGAIGADPSIGHCACLRRELSGEPDAGNLHLRFDEGRVGRATGVAFSPTLPISCMNGATKKKQLDRAGLLMEVADDTATDAVWVRVLRQYRRKHAGDDISKPVRVGMPGNRARAATRG